jgi:hypothetical protein
MKILYSLLCFGICIMIVYGKIKEKVYLNTLIPLGARYVTRFQTFLDISVQDCVSKCKNIRKCRYINYFSRLHTCDLISSTSDNVYVTRQPGIIFGDKGDWEVVSLRTCVCHVSKVS